MRRRVFVVAGEYSANPRSFSPERRQRAFFAEPHPELSSEEVTRLFFRFPNRGDDGRTQPEDWQRAFGIAEPVGLSDLLASAGHRALTTLHALRGGEYRRTRDAITDLFVTSMPGLDPNERVNVGLLPQALRALLALSPRTRAQFVAGTSDSGAWAFAQAVRAARNAEQPATILVLAGQIIPAGYVSQYQIRTVLGEDDQAHGLDMLAVGDLIMDVLRRNFGVRRDDLERLLERVAARKLQAGTHYPAGIQVGKRFRRDAPRTPWFDASDIAVPCCGAAATIVTSDEALVDAIATMLSPRFRTTPVTEVLGVGEGSSNRNLLHRKSPLLFATAVRDALADTADDARQPMSTFASCAFGVVHDAFPSIELSFLLGLGLGWERSVERMGEGWSNPVGGLLTFGHALGASGLVQVNKAHHLFCVDHRYIVEQPGRRRQGFREDGALAFTTSVGGPLSHIVAALFRGGHHELRPVRERPVRSTDEVQEAPLSEIWDTRRHQLRLALPSYLRGVPGTWLVEGTTSVSIRSCLHALAPADVARLTFEGIEELVAPAKLEDLRKRLRDVVGLVQEESGRLSTMFDAFRLLTDQVHEIAGWLRAGGFTQPKASALDEDRLSDQLKECLRVPLLVLCRPGDGGAQREVRFLPFAGLTAASFEEVDLVSAETGLPVPSSPAQLPFWNARAARPEEKAEGAQPGSPAQLVDRINGRAGGPHSAAELDLLRAWFAPDPSRILLDRALRALGAQGVREEVRVRSVFYLGEIAASGTHVSAAAAHELLGSFAREARAYLDAYESSVTQIGSTLTAVTFERPPFRTGTDEALLSVTRFAQEIARSAREHGVVVRAAICSGEGALFEDVSGRPAVASALAARAAELLAGVSTESPARPAFALEGASSLLVALLGQRLVSWELRPDGPSGSGLWLGPTL